MEKRRHYRNPPIQEALCEFRFQSGQDWDPTIPGKLHVKLGDEYGGKPKEQKVINVALNTQQGQPPGLSYGEGVAKVQLVTEDGKRLVAVGRDVLSIHMLCPYQDPNQPDSGWCEFQNRIKRALDAYWKVVQPKGVFRVGIRYINKIAIPQSAVEVEDYLRCALPVVDGLPDRLNNFMSRMDCSYKDDVRLVLSQGSVTGSPTRVEFLLDLDVIWERPRAISKDEALTKASELRDREREAFEAVITDKARELFGVD